MDFLFFLLFLITLKKIDNVQNYFFIKSINEEFKNEEYSRQVVNDNGDVYILTAIKRQQYNNYYRYVNIFDSNTCSFSKQFKYISQYNLCGGELMFIGDNSRYIYISSIISEPNSAECEIVDIKKETNTINLCSMYGYRRQILKDGSYYYQMYLTGENNEYLNIDKMRIDKYINDFPHLEIIKNDHSVKVRGYEGMISCDITGDKAYILCTYFSGELEVCISIFDKNLVFIKTKCFEKVSEFPGDNFIKIVYFKDNSDFILMDSQDNNIIRFRYFSYKNGIIIDKLSPIINNKDTYLDISNIQFHCSNGENELMVFDSEKIINYACNGNENGNNIIIAIFQFYNNYSIMAIKKYDMVNNNGCNTFWQSRINLLKNSFIVSVSALKNEIRFPGYFIINYPNSTDINLDKSNIVINKLISLENKLYSVILKFKVLSIPKDFKIVSKSKSLEINNNEEFELNDELILRQYRVNEGPYILKYQAIARGTDSGYTYLIKYPSNAQIKDNNVLLEGRHGQITINLKSCLNGYYNFEYDKNLCSNIKPKGYYIDEKNKMYRACPNTCEECNAPNITHVNCLSCKLNYYLTEDTSACYKDNIDNYYLDKNDNKLKKCHKNCLRCTTKATNETHMNCIKCQNNLYMTEDTHSCFEGEIDNYYLDKNDNMLKKCYKYCLRCSTKANNITYMNCLKCQNYYFMTDDTFSCYNEVLDNYYLDKVDNKLKKCHKNCLRCTTQATNETHMNCKKCQNNLYMTEDTKSCYEGEIDNYYLDKNDNILKKCHKNCLRCTTKSNNETHMNCTKCQANLYITEDTKSCYEGEINNYYLDKNDNILKRCHTNCLRCKSSSINDINMRCKICQPNFYMTEDTDSCYNLIPENYYLDKNTLKKCYERCSNCLGPKNNQTMNCLGCISSEYFYKIDTYDCIKSNEFNKKETLEFTKLDNIYFYFFLFILISALIIFICNFIFYKIKGQKNQDDKNQQKNESKENKNDDIEMAQFNDNLKSPINEI